MNWIQRLYDTYENCINKQVSFDEKPLLPINHTLKQAHIEVYLDQNGNLLRDRSKVIPKIETIIPATEKSSTRTTNDAPHPLCDKLQYCAKDYADFGGLKKHYFNSYQKQLEKWCNSTFTHCKIRAIYLYISKGNLIDDLVKEKILFLNGDGKLMTEWNSESPKPEIFKYITDDQGDAFVRWVVEVPGEPASECWKDKSLYEAWGNYVTSQETDKGLCMVTGELTSLAIKHPARIRNSADGAKLISSNDLDGFTFLGRFSSAKEAAGISSEVTQKAHSALRWLIDRQGYKKGDQAIVAWSIDGEKSPDPFADPLAYFDEGELPTVESGIVVTAQELALKLKKKIAGYNQNLSNTNGIVVIGLDSATPGRLAITFYRELTGSVFLRRLETWHEKCAWFHDYGVREIEDKKTGKLKKYHIRFTGAPAPDDIAQAAYGTRLDDKLRKSTAERLLPCIIDGQQVPHDLVESLRNRACNRIGLENWEWRKVLGISCALYKKYHEKEGFDMALEESRTSRNYLYGRLLALADSLEQWALSKAGENRQTTAARLMQRFADHPASTWRTIELALVPYKARLGGKSIKRQRLMDEVKNKFESADDYNLDKPLSGEFLLAYSCQKEKLRLDALLYKKQLEEKKVKGQVTQEEEIDEEEIESI